jgi:hypothetical protein
LLAGLVLPTLLLLLATLAGLVLPTLLATLLTTLVLLAALLALLVWITHQSFPRLLTGSGGSTAARELLSVRHSTRDV